jgi:preprotein translocase subunit SecA
MQTDDISESLAEIRAEVVDIAVSEFIAPESVEEQWNVTGLEAALESEFGARLDVKRLLDDEPGLDEAGIRARILAAVEEGYLKKFDGVDVVELRLLEKQLMLQQVDLHWKEHLAAMDYLRQGIHLRGYAQKNPKQEYKREAFEMFGAMLDRVKRDVVTILAKARIQNPDEVAAEEVRRRMTAQLQYRHDEAPSAMTEGVTEPEPGGEAPADPGASRRPLVARPFRPPPGTAEPTAPMVRGEKKVGRNEPCPCGSGKKYKQCHGRLD